MIQPIDYTRHAQQVVKRARASEIPRGHSYEPRLAVECHAGTRAPYGQFRVHAWTKRLRGLALDIIMRYDIIINTYSIRCRTVITRLIKLFFSFPCELRAVSRQIEIQRNLLRR